MNKLDLGLEETMKAGWPTCPSLPETFLASTMKVPEKLGPLITLQDITWPCLLSNLPSSPVSPNVNYQCNLWLDSSMSFHILHRWFHLRIRLVKRFHPCDRQARVRPEVCLTKIILGAFQWLEIAHSLRTSWKNVASLANFTVLSHFRLTTGFADRALEPLASTASFGFFLFCFVFASTKHTLCSKGFVSTHR